MNSRRRSSLTPRTPGAALNSILWLASYPKSGNTWVRLLIGALSLADGEAFELNDSIQNDGNANARALVDELSLIETALLTHQELDELRPDVYPDLAHNPSAAAELLEEAAPQRLRFMKVHDAYTLNRSGRPVLGGAQAACGALVIVRDPRDIAPSLAHNFDISIDRAIDMINDNRLLLRVQPGKQDPRLPQTLMGWSANVASWLDQRDLPVHMIRYENLKRDTATTLHTALNAIGLGFTMEAVARAAALCAFERLQARERESGFIEASDSGAAFFRRGLVGGWRDELTAEQVRRLERVHASMMTRLGYKLSGA